MFTRRHYQFVADEVGRMYPYEANGEFFRVVEEWSKAFKSDNPRFDADRFQRAAERSRDRYYGHRSNHSYMFGHESTHDETVRCHRAETTRDCPRNHDWDGDKAYHRK